MRIYCVNIVFHDANKVKLSSNIPEIPAVVHKDMHGKGLLPSGSTHTISQWPEGLLRSSSFLILTTYNIFAAVIKRASYIEKHR